MKLLTKDGQQYEVSGDSITLESATQLVEIMRQDSHSPSQSIKDFMSQVAHRCKIQNGATVRTESPELFVIDLLEFEFLEEIDGSGQS